MVIAAMNVRTLQPAGWPAHRPCWRPPLGGGLGQTWASLEPPLGGGAGEQCDKSCRPEAAVGTIPTAGRNCATFPPVISLMSAQRLPKMAAMSRPLPRRNASVRWAHGEGDATHKPIGEHDADEYRA